MRCAKVSPILLVVTLLLPLAIRIPPNLVLLTKILTRASPVLTVPLINLPMIDVGCLTILLVVTRPANTRESLSTPVTPSIHPPVTLVIPLNRLVLVQSVLARNFLVLSLITY